MDTTQVIGRASGGRCPPAQSECASELLALRTGNKQERPAPIILIAEDDAASARLIEHILGRAGFSVRIAANGEAVFPLVADSVPGLFLLDCDMPVMDGFEVCRRLKADPRFYDVPVIFLTALAAPEDKRRGFDAGGVDFVTKPVEFIELLARIRTHLELASHRQQLRRRVNLLEEVVLENDGRFAEVRDGQLSLLTEPAAFSELKLVVRYQPAHEAGGDFYEIARLSEDGDYGLLVADVSGHDLSVPYTTGGLKALAVTFLKEALSPQETMLLLDSSLQKFLQPHQYVTACYLKYSQACMEVEIISAAHPPALHLARDGTLQYINLSGDVLGMVKRPVFESRRLEACPGERLFIYTDGLVESYRDEARGSGRVLYGMQRLKEEISKRRNEPLEELVKAVVDGVLAECGGGSRDDIVMVGVEF